MKKRVRIGIYVPLLFAYFVSLRFWSLPELLAATTLLLLLMAFVNARTERLPQ